MCKKIQTYIFQKQRSIYLVKRVSHCSGLVTMIRKSNIHLGKIITRCFMSFFTTQKQTYNTFRENTNIHLSKTKKYTFLIVNQKICKGKP